MYGQNLSNTRFQADETLITRDSVGQMRQRWFFRTGRDVTATPIVADGTVYVGDFGGRFWALDARTGAVRWQRRLNGPVIDTAVFHDGTIYVGDNFRTFWALDAGNGSVRWSVQPEQTPDIAPYAQFWGSPVVFDGRVLVGLSAEDKEITLTLTRKVWRGSVVALDVADGRLLWQTPSVPKVCAPGEPDGDRCNGGSVWTTPAVDTERRIAYWGTGNAYDAPAAPMTDAMIAVDVDSGDVVWAHQFTADDYWSYGPNIAANPDLDFGSSPVLFEVDGRSVVGEGQKSGVFHVVDREDGEVVWSKKFAGTRSGSSGGGMLSSPAYAYGKVFMGATHDVIDTPVNTMSKHMSFTGAEGDLQWELPSPAWLWSAAAVTNRVMFQGNSLGMMMALDTDTGAILWTSAPLGSMISSGPAIANGAVFFGIGCCGAGGDSNGVYAFEIPGA